MHLDTQACPRRAALAGGHSGSVDAGQATYRGGEAGPPAEAATRCQTVTTPTLLLLEMESYIDQ